MSLARKVAQAAARKTAPKIPYATAEVAIDVEDPRTPEAYAEGESQRSCSVQDAGPPIRCTSAARPPTTSSSQKPKSAPRFRSRLVPGLEVAADERAVRPR